MDILASRLAKDANFKSKLTKNAKKLSKDGNSKSKTRSIPKVDSSKVGKITKKQKVKNVVTVLPPKKVQIIKDLIKSDDNKKEILLKKVKNLKNKKSNDENIIQKVKAVKKSLNVISKSGKAGKKVAKKKTEVLKNKINLQSDEKSSLNVISSKKGPVEAKNKLSKNIQTELIKNNNVKQIKPEVIKSKKIKKVKQEVAKNEKVQKIKQELAKNEKVQNIKPKIEKSKKVKPDTVKISQIEVIKPGISKNVKPVKVKNIVVEEKPDDSDKKKILKLSKSLKSKNAKLVKVENNEEIKSIKSKKRKLEEVEEDDSQITTGPTLTKKEILPYVKALLKVAANESKSKNSLFDSEKPPIFLSVTSIKIPKVALHQMRILLPHSMVTDNDEIVLFVKDLKKGRRRDYEDTVRHYEDLLQQHGCTRVKTIIPMNQVKTEYRQYEMRRRLLNSYDYFLADGIICGHLAHLLGKTFRLKRKLPTPIHMDNKDLKQAIDTALKKTSLEIHSTGDSSVTQVATCSMSVDKIAENIIAVVTHLAEHFPGGWENIRSLSLKTPLGFAIPIYTTLKNRNTVKVPVVNPKRPKAYKDVEGELSTFIRNVNVKVAADGTVDVHHLGGNDSDIEDDEEEENEEVVEKIKNKIKIKKEKTKKSIDQDDSDEGDEDDDEDDDDDDEDKDEESDDE